VVIALVGTATASSALAQQPPAQPDRAETSPVIVAPEDRQSDHRSPDHNKLPEGFEPGVLPTLAAVFPGVLFHGTGLWAAGADQAAYELARIEAIGLVGSTLGLIGVYATGASSDTVELIYYPSMVAISAFVMPWFADLYGASVGGREADARHDLAPIEARAGYAYIHDPVFDYAHFSYVQADVRLEPVRLIPSAWISLGQDNQRLRLEGHGRLLGPRAGVKSHGRDGSFLDIETGITYHQFGTEQFETLVLEAKLAGRYDMRRLSPVLRGSFYELAMGVGGQLFGYAAADGELGEDVSALLLMRTAYGVYFGPSGDRYGEAKVYYNHRHDGFAAGSGFNSDIDGLFGHAGIEGFYYLSDSWGLFADFKAAAAYVALTGVTFRYGGN
jgi:hypothetical protein